MSRFRSNLIYINQLLRRLGFILLLFLMIKLLFYGFNKVLFPIESFGQVVKMFFSALRFDIAAIIYINALFILLSLFPTSLRQNPRYQGLQKFVFIFCNGIAVAFELIDIGFFKFTTRRTIGSDLTLFKNTAEMIPGFIKEYWFLLVLFIGLLFLLHFFYKKTKVSFAHQETSLRIQILIFIGSLILFGIGARGGVQLRPLMPITAIQYVDDNRLAPLISNTSLGLIFSSQQTFLEEQSYFPASTEQEIFNTFRHYHKGDNFDKKNIFIIVLESFGKEHISHFNPKNPTTPFLDSLIKQSFYLEQTYANADRSTKGIVSITSSIPSLMQAPLMFSAYQSNRVDGLAKLLGKKDYITTFFHGANPGSMEFERFSKLSGFQNYLDRIDFNNDQEYDGQWGIWDEPFFKYAAQEVSQYDKPFCALLFSLSSHHPYKTPDWFEQQYTEMPDLLRSVRYTDYALEQFFQMAQKKPWFDNTIFVITADHIGKSSEAIFQTSEGKYRVPLLLFDPNQQIKGMKKGLSQQIDIMPTVLDWIQYNEPFAAFGKSMLDTLDSNYSINLNNGIYQILDDQHLLLYDGKEVLGLYDYHSDPFLKEDISKSNGLVQKRLEDQLKAILQTHHRGMIRNELYRLD